MSESSTGTMTFFPVALAMLETGRIVPCEIWLRHEGATEPVLYRAGNLPFDAAHRRKLQEFGVETVFVPFKDAARWTGYLEGRLRERVADRAVPAEHRAEILITSSRSIMKDVYADPLAPATMERITTVADAICDFMREPSALAATVRVMEHDYYTYTHCLHVAVYGVSLARAAGIDAPDVLAGIGRGALMHDCGKCKLAPALINKPGRFNAEEWEQMKLHPDYGVDVLHETGWRDPLVEEVVACHHERLDGSGYPRAVAGRQVPISARIAAICDAFDAMTTDRAYQRARQGIQALRVLRVEDRDKYDQTLSELFIRMLIDNPA